MFDVDRLWSMAIKHFFCGWAFNHKASLLGLRQKWCNQTTFFQILVSLLKISSNSMKPLDWRNFLGRFNCSMVSLVRKSQRHYFLLDTKFPPLEKLHQNFWKLLRLKLLSLWLSVLQSFELMASPNLLPFLMKISVVNLNQFIQVIARIATFINTSCACTIIQWQKIKESWKHWLHS